MIKALFVLLTILLITGCNRNIASSSKHHAAERILEMRVTAAGSVSVEGVPISEKQMLSLVSMMSSNVSEGVDMAVHLVLTDGIQEQTQVRLIDRLRRTGMTDIRLRYVPEEDVTVRESEIMDIHER